MTLYIVGIVKEVSKHTFFTLFTLLVSDWSSHYFSFFLLAEHTLQCLAAHLVRSSLFHTWENTEQSQPPTWKDGDPTHRYSFRDKTRLCDTITQMWLLHTGVIVSRRCYCFCRCYCITQMYLRMFDAKVFFSHLCNTITSVVKQVSHRHSHIAQLL